MKLRFVSLLLILVLLVSGCASLQRSYTDGADFYYRRAEYHYNEDNPVIVSERREVAGRRQDLKGLLELYLLGPLDDKLVSPFPKGTRLLEMTQESGSLTIVLSDTARSLTDANFSLACECVSRTCMELADVSTVTVVSGSRTITTPTDSVLLCDEATIPAESEEPTP